MNSDSNIETDRLLRRYARHGRDASTNFVERPADSVENNVRENNTSIAHLDPDELSSYAENALPAGARLRYTTHLADCDSCRKLMIDLVLSSGAVSELESKHPNEALSKKRSWRDWLAVMFAPRVLRYAASIVIFLGVAAIALVVFRSQRDMKFGTSPSRTENGATNQDVEVSKNQGNKAGQPTNSNASTSDAVPGENSKPDPSTDSSNTVNRDLPLGVSSEVQKSGQEQGEAKPPPPASGTADVITDEPSQQRDKDSNVAARQQPALSGTTGGKITENKDLGGADSRARNEREVQGRKENDEVAGGASANASASKPASSVEESSANKRKARRKSETPPKNDPAPVTMDDRGERVDKAGSAAERRTVNGKQFVRRDGAWVDMSYRSQATTIVRRGSEQFRALMADEPGLRAIANQLGGEIVVVWNGRAYRIR